MLSPNTFMRLSVSANHIQHGTALIAPGTWHQVTFEKEFDWAAKAFFTYVAHYPMPILLRESRLTSKDMIILSSMSPESTQKLEPVEVNWAVYGFTNIDVMNEWELRFYTALIQLENGAYKAAFLDYESAFEAFVATFLREQMGKIMEAKFIDHILNRTQSIEPRCTNILKLVIGHSMSENKDVFSAWQNNVQRPRNSLVHGQNVRIEKAEAEAAHSSVYEAIRWIQDLRTAEVAN